jgi:hypothetical protein
MSVRRSRSGGWRRRRLTAGASQVRASAAKRNSCLPSAAQRAARASSRTCTGCATSGYLDVLLRCSRDGGGALLMGGYCVGTIFGVVLEQPMRSRVNAHRGRR